MFNVLLFVIFVISFLAGIDPCFNGEQNGYENGVDCGGDCEQECATETSRTIPWLLWAAPTI